MKIENRVIYYVAFITSIHKSVGIIKKIKAQYDYCERNEYKVKLIIFTLYENEKLDWGDPDKVELRYGHPEKRDAYTYLVGKIKDYTAIIYFRGIFPSKHFINFLGKYDCIYEHNTKELLEFEANFKNASIIKLLYRYIRYGNRINQVKKIWPTMLHNLAGGIAVTEEISKYEKSFHPQYICKVVSNGIHFNKETMPNQTLEKSSDIVQFAFLLGSPHNWHGLERIIESFESYNPIHKIMIHVAGYLDQVQLNSISQYDNIKYHGMLDKNEVSQLLSNCDIGIGTLALYKKGMEEACPLKVREYLKFGLPVLLGYRDTDLSSNPIFKEFIYKVPNDSSAIDFNSIYKWAINLINREDIRKKVVEKAKAQLSIDVKTKALFYSIREIISEKEGSL